MSTPAFKMTKEEAQERLKTVHRQQDAIVEKWSWPELTDVEYIRSEHRLAECNAEEVLLLNTIKLWEGIEKSKERIKKRQAEPFFPSEKIDFTKDSEYARLLGE
jgi:hypothetical protein